jgi:hypothetical protein
MLALVLLRASSKQDALKMTWALSSLSDKPAVLPNMVTMLCMVRCCALLPCYAEVKNPFMVKEAGDTGLACPLGLPTSRGTDCRRVPLALSAPYRFRIERGGLQGTTLHLVQPPGKTLEQQQAQHERRMNVLQLASICRINGEWVRVPKQEVAVGQPLKLVRRVFDSEEAQCGPSERAELVPHLMLPEGSEGITELHARILVSAHAEHSSEWLACAPFSWMYPKDLPKAQWRTPMEHLYGLVASAAFHCHVDSAAPSQADKARVKYLMDHTHVVLKVASKQLLAAYPQQIKKVAMPMLALTAKP